MRCFGYLKLKCNLLVEACFPVTETVWCGNTTVFAPRDAHGFVL